MPSKEREDARIVSVRLPTPLVQRLDRVLDWQTTHRRRPATRNAALREALRSWLDEQEQLAGLLEPQALQQQFQAAYHSLRPSPDGVPIYRLRRLLQWPRERFDAVLEALRAVQAVDLETLTEQALDVQATQDSHPAHRQLRVPDTVVHELQRLKGLYAGFGFRELARIIFHTTMYRLTGKTAQRLWERLPPAAPPARPLFDYHSHPERAHARLEVITLYAQGWSKRSISQFLQVSRPTINTWIARFERDNAASLVDQSSAPHAPARKVWLPVMLAIY